MVLVVSHSYWGSPSQCRVFTTLPKHRDNLLPPIQDASLHWLCSCEQVCSPRRVQAAESDFEDLKSLYICISLFINPFYIKNMYLTLLFLVIKLLALYSTKYSLNYLSICLARNNPVYTTWSITMGNFYLLCLIFNFI